MPSILNTSLIDGIIKVDNNTAMQTMRNLAKKEGLLIGISAAAQALAPAQVAKENPEKTIVCILPDIGERYLSTNLYELN